MALVLALVGIFSVVAYSVAQRSTEFGIRLALGASRAYVLWAAARIALVSAAAGMLLGLAVNSFLGALLACLLPARHALAVPPAETLRYE